MRDWRSRLEKWVRGWDRLQELTQDCFPVRPQAGATWPAGLPCCPALADFYARCDGGTFGPYTFLPAAELADPAAGWLEDSPGLEPVPGRWVHVGDHEYGHALLWDSGPDEVVLYSPDDEEPRRLGRTMDQFLGRLFHPSVKASSEATQLWAEALAEADKLG
jgi:hypothetical protein